MPRYVAFLRAINVSGHTLKMDKLRQIFEQLDYEKVETFIASGNVIFETPIQYPRQLEEITGATLKKTLGYEAPVFIRTGKEVASIAAYQAFPLADMEAAIAFNIAFLYNIPDKQAISKLMALKTDIDDFHIHEREIYWLCKKKQSDSTFSNAVLEKALGSYSTLRGINTIKKLTNKYQFS